MSEGKAESCRLGSLFGYALVGGPVSLVDGVYRFCRNHYHICRRQSSVPGPIRGTSLTTTGHPRWCCVRVFERPDMCRAQFDSYLGVPKYDARRLPGVRTWAQVACVADVIDTHQLIGYCQEKTHGVRSLYFTISWVRNWCHLLDFSEGRAWLQALTYHPEVINKLNRRYFPNAGEAGDDTDSEEDTDDDNGDNVDGGDGVYNDGGGEVVIGELGGDLVPSPPPSPSPPSSPRAPSLGPVPSEVTAPSCPALSSSSRASGSSVSSNEVCRVCFIRPMDSILVSCRQGVPVSCGPYAAGA
jgi:hypothetical protein